MEHASAPIHIKTHQLRRRVSIDCSSPQLTDQSFKDMTDINNIMEQYVKTGLLPNYSSTPLLYIDDTMKPSFEEAHAGITYARQRFDLLPTALKQELNNDYRKFQSWIENPDNAHRAEQFGLISIHKPQSPPPKVEAEPAKPAPAP